METAWKAGLEDAIAARSAICRVDGAAGRLYYRGYEIGELAGAVSFEDVTALLWFGELPRPSEAVAFAARLRAARGLPAPVRTLLETLPRDTHPLDALRTAVSLAAAHDPDAGANDPAANLRVAVATLADLHAAVVAAIATLKGPRHGGANEDVLAMLLEIGDPARAEAFVERRLAARAALSKQARGDPQARVPGFGHRVYKVDDARARVLRGMAKSMAEATGRQRLFEVAERVVDAVRARTTLPVNVDFFSAVVYDALGIPPDFCTAIFAAGRVAGWCAHALEQYADNRLIRPRAAYIGPAPRPFPAR